MKKFHRNDKLRWQVLNRELILDSPIFRVFRSQRFFPLSECGAEEKRGEFYNIESNDWANIIPLIQNGQGQDYDVILVEQFRHGSEEMVLEFPAGVIEKGEEPAECALRELREETGYEKVLRCAQIGVSYPNPAIMSNRTYTYCVLLQGGVEPMPLQLDELESLQTHRMSLAALKQLIFTEDSAFSSALMLQSMFWLENSDFLS